MQRVVVVATRLTQRLAPLPWPRAGAAVALPVVPRRGLGSAADTAVSPFTDDSGPAGVDGTVDVATGGDRVYDEKLVRLVDEILQLNLLETAELCELLQDKLGLAGVDFNTMGMGDGGGGGGGGGSGGGAAADAGEPEEAKTHFDVKLTTFDAKAKIKIIKEVRGATSLGLKEAKELVESAPCVLVKDMKKEDAEALAETIKGLGGDVALE